MNRRPLSTPNFFVNFLRLIRCNTQYVQIKPHPNHVGWNDWVFATKHGNPYIVVSHHNVMFSIGRVRSSRHHQWRYRIFWPFGSREQNVRVVDTPQDIIDLIEDDDFARYEQHRDHTNDYL